MFTPAKFNIAPEQWWLADDPFLLGFGKFSGAFAVKLREGNLSKIYVQVNKSHQKYPKMPGHDPAVTFLSPICLQVIIPLRFRVTFSLTIPKKGQTASPDAVEFFRCDIPTDQMRRFKSQGQRSFVVVYPRRK